MNEILNLKLISIGSHTFTLYNIVKLLFILFLAKIIIVIISFALEKYLKRDSHNEERLNSILQLLKYTIWTTTFFIALESIGINLTILLAGSAALLVGLGLGIQQTFNDLISGIIILAEGSLKKNDVVEVDGLIGKVYKIKLRTSVINTRDGINIIVPNHKFINENVINWSHHSMATRFKIQISVAYGSDEELVKNILKKCLLKEENVIKNEPQKHPIFIRIIEFGDNAIIFEILFWSTEIFVIEQIKSNIRFFILDEFRKNKITIPFPQRDIHIKKELDNSL